MTAAIFDRVSSFDLLYAKSKPCPVCRVLSKARKRFDDGDCVAAGFWLRKAVARWVALFAKSRGVEFSYANPSSTPPGFSSEIVIEFHVDWLYSAGQLGHTGRHALLEYLFVSDMAARGECCADFRDSLSQAIDLMEQAAVGHPWCSDGDDDGDSEAEGGAA